MKAARMAVARLIRRPAVQSTVASQHPACDPKEVAKVAYELFLQRGGGHGCHEEDWLKAERMVRARQTNGTSRAKTS